MKNVPTLRFKAFSGEWQAKKLGEVTKTITSGSRDWAQYYADAGSKFIRMTNLSRDGIHLKLDDLKFVDVNSLSADGKRTSLVSGDVLISITAELGKIGWIPSNFGEAFINQHTALVRIKADLANSKLIAYLLSTPKINKKINKLNDAGAKAGLNLPTIKSIDFYFPALQEQTKIADFLTAIDDRISQLAQKCELLEQYKKGVMQKIFSQELRFKDEKGRAFPAWEGKRLGDVYSFKVTNSFSRENLNYESGTVKNVHYGDIHTKFSPLFYIKKEKVPFVNEDIALDKIKPENYCIEGDVIFADASEDLNDVGKSIEVISLNGEKLLSGLHTLLARQIGNFFYKGFAGYLFKSNAIRVQIQKEAQGSKVLSISATRLVNIKISVPCIEEQAKIAGFLSAVDEKISQAQAQLEAAKRYKQGLLQQMFV